MVYRYRIIMLRCRWLITPVIRCKTSRISRLCAGATGIAEILFKQPVRLLPVYRGFHYRGSRNYFLRITRQRPSTGHYQRRADCRHNQQNHGTNNRRLHRLNRLTCRLTRRCKSVTTCILVAYCGGAVTFSGKKNSGKKRHRNSLLQRLQRFAKC